VLYSFVVKKSTLVIVVVIGVILALGLVGTFVAKKVTQKVGEKILEKTIESQTGEKVDINSGKNGGEITIKTNDGKVQYTAGGDVKIPENFPKELIIASDAKAIMASSSENGSTVTYLTNISQDDLYSQYPSALDSLGWKKELEVNTGKGKMLEFKKDKSTVAVTIGDNATKESTEKTLVNLVLSIENE
jgi:hypothetical protein